MNVVTLTLAGGLLLAQNTGLADSRAAEVQSARPKEPRSVELQGRVVCLSELVHRLYGTEPPQHHEHQYGFQTNEGQIYTLLRTRFTEALFADQRVREKELLLKGRVLPDSQILDVTRIRSIRDGAVCDLYYYCNICNIKTISPGPCACCQGPVELTERPVSDRKK